MLSTLDSCIQTPYQNTVLCRVQTKYILNSVPTAVNATPQAMNSGMPSCPQPENDSPANLSVLRDVPCDAFNVNACVLELALRHCASFVRASIQQSPTVCCDGHRQAQGSFMLGIFRQAGCQSDFRTFERAGCPGMWARDAAAGQLPVLVCVASHPASAAAAADTAVVSHYSVRAGRACEESEQKSRTSLRVCGV